MAREEWIARGDRSHPNLVELDGLNLAYEGWEDDVAKAEEYHVNLPMEFQDKLTCCGKSGKRRFQGVG